MANIRPICPALAKKAKEELNEDPGRIKQDIDILRDWISKQPHLKSRTDDQFLVSFLRGSKYSIERAKEKIDMFYTVRNALPELFKDRNVDDPKTREIIKMGVGINLPLTAGEDGPRITLIRPGVYDPQKFHIKEIMKVSTLMADIQMLEDDNIIIAGNLGILDLANVGKGHFLQFDPVFMKKMTMLGQEASPLRQKGFHYVHTPPTFEMIYNIFKTFMNEKNKSRLRVHGDNMDSLFEYVDQKLLPLEYGGLGGPIQDTIDEWEKKILSYRDFFLEDEQYGVNEKLRPGKPKTDHDLFGVDGTFRQLNVD